MTNTTVPTTTETRRPFTTRAAEAGGKVWTGNNGETRVYFEQVYARVIDDAAGRVAWNPIGTLSQFTFDRIRADIRSRLPKS